MTCNADILAQARANVADSNNPAHRKAICERGEWDPLFDGGLCVAGMLVQAEIERLLKHPPKMEGAPDG